MSSLRVYTPLWAVLLFSPVIVLVALVWLMALLAWYLLLGLSSVIVASARFLDGLARKA